MDLSFLPSVNASLNLLSSILLIAGKVAQRRGNIYLHIRIMCAALVSSTLFLTCYLAYHFSSHLVTRWQLPYQGVYYTMLVSHIILAIVMLPFIIAAVYYAATSQITKHRRIVRWVWPVWVYVSITGVLIYLLLYHIQGYFLAA